MKDRFGYGYVCETFEPSAPLSFAPLRSLHVSYHPDVAKLYIKMNKP
jgi:hypothetical protein